MNKKTIWITGGSTGIGKALALNFLKDGHNVIITYNKSYEHAIEIEQNKGIIYKVDVTDYNACIDFTEDIINKFKRT